MYKCFNLTQCCDFQEKSALLKSLISLALFAGNFGYEPKKMASVLSQQSAS